MLLIGTYLLINQSLFNQSVFIGKRTISLKRKSPRKNKYKWGESIEGLDRGIGRGR
jgi:hypothetical protein